MPELALEPSLIAAVFWWVVLSGLAPLTRRTPILYLLFALISGNVTLITIVVSISQFVLARHLETPGEVLEQMREVVGYRQTVSDVTGERVVPVTPSGFFLVLFRGVDRDVERIRTREWGEADTELRRDLANLVEDLETHAEYVIGLVEGSGGGIRHALFATLDANYSRYFYGVYRLRSVYGDDLPAGVADDLDRLERHLEQVDVARRYFKTVLIQSELASLSRLLLFFGLPVLVTNCSNNYGPYQFPEKLIPLALCRLLEGEPVPVYGDGQNVRDWLYVTDHCDALLRVLEAGAPGETYNIGGRAERANLEVVRLLVDLVDRRLGRTGQPPEDRIRFVKDRPGHDLRYAIDSAKIERELGWRPVHTFEEGMERTVDWYLNHPDWVRSIRTGDYREWIRRNYGERDSKFVR